MSRAWPSGWSWSILGMVAVGRSDLGSSIHRAIQSARSRAPASARLGASVASSGMLAGAADGRGRGVALQAAEVGQQLPPLAEPERRRPGPRCSASWARATGGIGSRAKSSDDHESRTKASPEAGLS